MKLFTIKDLIHYNAPCKSCSNKTNFYLKFYGADFTDTIKCNPVINGDRLQFDLKITYKNRLSLIVSSKTNEFVFKTGKQLDTFNKFKEENIMAFESFCKKCFTTITSDDLEFDFDFIKPVPIFLETVHFIDNNKRYMLSSNFDMATTRLIVYPTDLFPGDKNELELDLPLIPLYEIKNKEELGKKIKFLLTFS